LVYEVFGFVEVFARRVLRLNFQGVRLFKKSPERGEIKLYDGLDLKTLAEFPVLFSVDGREPKIASVIRPSPSALKISVKVIRWHNPLFEKEVVVKVKPGMRVRDFLSQFEEKCIGRYALGLAVVTKDCYGLIEIKDSEVVQDVVQRHSGQFIVERVPPKWIRLVVVSSLSPLKFTGMVYRLPLESSFVWTTLEGEAIIRSFFGESMELNKIILMGPDGRRCKSSVRMNTTDYFILVLIQSSLHTFSF
jgi:hypothetical protein